MMLRWLPCEKGEAVFLGSERALVARSSAPPHFKAHTLQVATTSKASPVPCCPGRAGLWLPFGCRPSLGQGGGWAEDPHLPRHPGVLPSAAALLLQECGKICGFDPAAAPVFHAGWITDGGGRQAESLGGYLFG